jgi:hypothetical protein
MEAVTQTARAARRYLSVLLSGDDAARKQLVFSPGRVSSRADVGAGEPARAHSEASGSRARASAARAPAEGADAPRVTSRFAVEAARVAGKRKRSETEGAKTSDRANETHSSPSRETSARRDGRASSNDYGRFRVHQTNSPRSILAVGGAKRKRGISEASSGAYMSAMKPTREPPTREDVFNGSAAERGCVLSEEPAATRRRLDLLRSVGVVKTRGGVPSTYNLGVSESVRENQNLGASPTTASGRVKLVVSSSRLPLGKIGAGRFRAGLPLASLRARGRFRAAATDPKVVRAELVDLPPDETPEANPPPAETSAAAAAAAAPERAFSFGTASAPAPPSLALGAGSMRRSKSRKGRDDDDDSLLGAALRDFNGGKTSGGGGSSSALEPKKSGAGDANQAASAFDAPAAKKENAPAADAAKPAAPAFTFGAAPAPAAAGDGAKSASAENPAAAASTGFTFGAAPPAAAPAAAPAFTFGAAPGASAPPADAAAPFAFGGAAAPPGGGMSMGAGSSAPAGRRVVRARRPGRR